MRGIRFDLQQQLMASAAMVAAAVATPAQAQTRNFDVPAQAASRSIPVFARQAGVQIIASGNVVRGRRTNAVRGPYTLQDGLRILLQGTGLEAAGDHGTGIITIRAAGQQGQGSAGESGATLFTGEAAPHGDTFRGAGQGAADGAAAMRPQEVEAEEILVTGTNIRGGSSASQTIVIDRGDIERSGLATTQQLIDRLPQHFGGSVSETTVSSFTGGSSINLSGGNGLDLRGLGTDSTLVLINGRRVASAGIGNFVDLSLIPLSAVERVEIVADGASAIYGSDAVGGVANFILRSDYDGAETRARFGTVTEGDMQEYQFGQLIGATWTGGGALLSYEFYKRDPLNANDRPFAAANPDPLWLLPKQRRHSVYFTINQDVGEEVGLFADGIYANRRANTRYNLFGFPDFVGAVTEQYGLTAGSRIDVGARWQAELRGTYDHNRTDQLNPTGSDFTGRSWSADAKAEGPVFHTPGGDVRLALGGQYRRETYDREGLASGIALEDDRDVLAAFGEVFVPLVGRENGSPGLRRLEMTAAVRIDDYSDFGTTVNPKLGLMWSPFEGLRIRGTYGTAFRAPLLFELDESSNQIVPYPAADPASPTGITNVLLILGNRALLEPEKATTVSAGFDLAPPTIPGFDLSLSFFSVDFRNRIGAPPADAFAAFGFAAEDLVGPFVMRNVDRATIEEIAARPGFADFFGIPLDQVTGIADFRTANLARVRVNGIDLGFSYSFAPGVGRLDLGVDATYLIDHKTRFVPTAGFVELVDTRFNPVDLVATASASWNYRGWTASAFVNYTDSYEDPSSAIDQVFEIDSWTTLDLALMYDTGSSPARGALRNVRLSLNILNLFDTDPPFVQNEFGLNYDGANASPLGRHIAFEVIKRW